MCTHLANTKLPVIHLSTRTDTGRVGLAWRWKIPDSGPKEQRKIGYIASKPEHLIYVIAQPMSLLARFKQDPTFKSP